MKKNLLAVGLAGAFAVAACSGGATPAPSGGGGGALAGTTVEVFGAFRGDEATRFEESIKPFEDATGVDVQYTGSAEFETLINTRVQAGDAPDVAALPQPGAMARFAAAGNLKALPADIVAAIDANYGPGWKESGSFEGSTYGVFHRVNAKGLVFYAKKAWDAAGYTAPTTWDELIALSDKIVADGGTPWCIGIESGNATGWVGTDWVEEIMLRVAGPEGYDKWVTNETKFTDPAVKAAWERMGEIWLNPAYVSGGTTTILTTAFGDAPTPMFDSPPGCSLINQGNFITGFFPEAIQADLDNEVGVFVLPEIDPQYGTPVEVGGDQFVMFDDRPEVVAFLQFLTTGESTAAWAAAGGAIFPHKDQDTGAYKSALDKQLAELLINAPAARFDGGDAMPVEVGSGTFWTGIVDYVSGKDLDTILAGIDASWP